MQLINNILTKLSKVSGFTRYELKALAAFTALLALGIIYINFRSEGSDTKTYSYSEPDSLYNAIIGSAKQSDSSGTRQKNSDTTKQANSSQQIHKLAVGEKVRINKASLAELQQIPGIGVKTAELIIDLRMRGITIKKADDLLEIKGVGKKKLEKIRPFISFD